LAFYSTVGAGGYKEYGGQIRSYSGPGIDYGDLRFFTGHGAVSVERARISSNGDLLVNTTGSAYSTSGRGVIEVNGSSNSIVSLKSGDNTTGYLYASYPDFFIANSASGPTIFENGGSEKMRLTSAGNLGIGTAPITKLDVNGVIRVGSGSGAGDPGTGGVMYIVGSGQFQTVIGGAAFAVHTGPNNARTEAMRIASAGEVGIGTSAPISGYKLTMEGNGAYAALRCVTNAGFSTLSGFDGATQRWSIGQAGFGGNNGLGFYVGSGTEVGRFDASGNLLVGCTSTAFASGQNTGIYLTNTTGGTGGLHIKNTANNTGTNVVTFYGWNDTQTGSILTYVNVTNYNTSSDARLKENIADADDASNLIDAIKVRKFNWKSDNSHQRYGMVAQELLEVAPEAVSQPEDPDDMMGVDYSKLVPMLVKEIQSLRARVAQLEGN
jgi:hypothetical protein